MNASKLCITLVLLTIISIFNSCTENGNKFNKEFAEAVVEKAWDQVPDILARIIPPEFPDAEYNILDYGALPDGVADCNMAINNAILECNRNGGGRVVIPSGQYLSNGPIHLLSNVNLHISEGAYVKFGTDPIFYTPLVLVRWEGTLCYNYSPLIYAHKQKNIAVTGKGIIDGQTQGTWAKWKKDNDGKNQKADKKILRQFGNDVTPIETRVFGNGFLDLNGDREDDGHGDGKEHYLRPTTIEFMECNNILIEGVTLRNSPFWNVHPVFCTNVTIRNLYIEKGTTNDDGLDPDSCTDVLIENCTINTNDDAIAIKAGRDQDAWDRPSAQNVIIRNCNLSSGVNGFCIGSEMSGDVRNVFVYDNNIPNSRRGINFKCNLDRGGQVEKIYIKNINFGTCTSELFIFRMDYHGYRGNNYPTKFNDFYVTDIYCESIEGTAFNIVGVETENIKRVFLKNFEIGNAKENFQIEFADDILLTNIMIGGKIWAQ
jgi:polygalacturonase